MSHHTVSGVTTIAVFIVTRCATIWMTVEMEVMRKQKTVSQIVCNLQNVPLGFQFVL